MSTGVTNQCLLTGVVLNVSNSRFGIPHNLLESLPLNLVPRAFPLNVGGARLPSREKHGNEVVYHSAICLTCCGPFGVFPR